MKLVRHIFSSSRSSRSSRSSLSTPPYDADVIIVGSGLSGLTTAYRLVKNGVRVLVLEATDTLGGRTRSITLPTSNELVSVGGTWVMLDDSALLHLADEVGSLPFIPQVQLKSNPRMVLHPYLLLKLWWIGREVSKNNPKYWKSCDAARYDKLSLQRWIDSQSGFLDDEESKKAVRDWFVIMENEYLDFSKISTLFAAVLLYQRLSNISSTGFIIPNIYRWEGGTGVFINRLVSEISNTRLGKFLTEAPVKRITQLDNQVVVLTGKGEFRAKYLVVSSAMPAAAQIEYDPPLPVGAISLYNSLLPCNVPSYNIFLVFRTRWNPGLSILPDIDKIENGYRGVFGIVMDMSSSSPSPQIIRILSDPSYLKGMTEDEIQESAITYLTSFYPELEEEIRSQFLSMSIFNWDNQQPWIPGTVYYYPPGILSKYGKYLRRPHDRIYWGSSERSLRGLHWMEGAVIRGTDVAADLLKEMGKIKSRTQYLEDLRDDQNITVAKLRSTDGWHTLSNLLRQIPIIRTSQLTELEKKIYRKIKKIS